MSDDTPTPAEQAARDAVRALPRERADDAFRARLKHEFTSGRIGRRREAVRERPFLFKPAFLVPVFSALLAVAIQQMNRGPDWRVLAASGDGRVVVGSQTFAATDTDAMASSALMRRPFSKRVLHVCVAGTSPCWSLALFLLPWAVISGDPSSTSQEP